MMVKIQSGKYNFGHFWLAGKYHLGNLRVQNSLFMHPIQKKCAYLLHIIKRKNKNALRGTALCLSQSDFKKL